MLLILSSSKEAEVSTFMKEYRYFQMQLINEDNICELLQWAYNQRNVVKLINEST